MKSLFIVIVLLFLSGIVHADLYMWVDENGVRHYSDTASPEDGDVEVNETRGVQIIQGEDPAADRTGKDREAIRDDKRRMDELDAWEEAEEADRLKRRREGIAEDFFIRAENVEADGEYGPEKGAGLLRSIAESCLKCTGRDIDTAEEYYELADSKVNEILDECEATVTKGSITFTKVTFGEREWSRKCVNKKIKEAVRFKKLGDKYMCSKSGKKKKSK